jgi:hypothetical protein
LAIIPVAKETSRNETVGKQKTKTKKTMQSPKKSIVRRAVGAVVTLIISLTSMAHAGDCPQCRAAVVENTTYSPAKMICARENISDFECKTHPDYTATITVTYTSPITGIVTSFPTTYNPCYTDDTQCSSS